MKYTSVNIRQLTNRKGKPWQARIKYKDPITGEWKDKSKILKDVKSKKEAKKLADAWLNEMNEAAANTPNIEFDKTVGEIVLQYLVYQLQSGELERSTYNRELSTYKTNVAPYVGDSSFATFGRDEVYLWLTKLNAKGLSQGTIGSAFYLVRKVYDYYYNLGELLRNPFAGIKPPKKSRPKTTHLTVQQMDDFLQATYADYNPEDRMFAALLLAFYGGLRRGEICGLRWRDLDLDTGTLTVETAIGVEKTTYTKQPKNQSSIRTFQMVPQLLEGLRERCRAIEPEPHWFVCGNGVDYYNPVTFSKDFKSFVRRHNLEDAYGKSLTPHMLRHNLGAIGIRSGMDIASLSRMFGHASRAMTLDTYGDASKDAMIVAAGKLGDKFDEDTEYFKIEKEGE